MTPMNQSVVSEDNKYIEKEPYTEFDDNVITTCKNLIKTDPNFSTQNELLLAMREQFTLQQKVAELLRCVLL